MNSRLRAGIESFIQLVRTPTPQIFVDQVRIVICVYFTYKLLSRDFSTFGRLPAFMLENYPWDSQGWQWYTLAHPALIDAITFHWIYWFTPLPSEGVLVLLQSLALAFTILVLVFGRGYYGCFSLPMFLVINHLWGFYWRSGADVDAVYVQLQILFWYSIFPLRETCTLPRPKLDFRRTEEAGIFFSVTLAVFTMYYFYSGLNKLSDISLIQWFQYDLAWHMRNVDALDQLAFFSVPQGHQELMTLSEFRYFFLYLGVPLVYISHLLTPIMFFDRRRIPVFWNFYMLFHVSTILVSVLFAGLVMMWLIFLPIRRFRDPVVLIMPNADGQLARAIRALDWFKRVRIRSGSGFIAWREAEDDREPVYRGVATVKAVIWPLPMLWPAIPLVYFFWYAMPVLFVKNLLTAIRRLQGPRPV